MAREWEAKRPWGFTKGGKRDKEGLGAARGAEVDVGEEKEWEVGGGGVAREWEAEPPWGFIKGGKRG